MIKKTFTRQKGIAISAAILLSAFAAAAFTGCKDKENAGSAANAVQTKVQEKASVSSTAEDMTLNGSKVSYESMEAFFVPDYTPEYPDEKPEEKTDAKKNAGSKGDKTTSFIPGIRKLSEYKTQYSDKKKQQVSYTPKPSEEPAADENPDISFKVSSWGPTKIVAEDVAPTFYVNFNKPVKPLAALDKESETSDVVTITPALKGKFHWYGTQNLSFEAEEHADPSTIYKIEVNPALKNIYGEVITGQCVFTTKAEPVQIVNLWGGYIKENMCSYNEGSGAKPPYENRFFIRMNQRLSAERLSKELAVSVGGKPAAYTVEASFEKNTFSYWNNNPEFDKEKGLTNSFIITITSEVPHNAKVVAQITSGGSTFSYSTLLPFELKDIDDYAKFTDGTMGNPLYICFNQPVDEKSVLENVHVNIDYTMTKDNFKVSGNVLIIHSLPVTLGTKYEITFDSGLKDIYGQTLSAGAKTYTFSTRPIRSYVNYLDWGAKMLEAQYPHKIIYEYQNALPGSFYTLTDTENPLNIKTDKTPAENSVSLPENETPNVRHFQEIDLNPLLTNGYGFVKFNALTQIKEFNYWSNKEKIEDEWNTMTVQVTDFGITTRLGINKAVVMVRSLSTGKPVADATVKILNDASKTQGDPLTNLIAQGKTDSNGLCVISYTEEQIRKYEQSISRSYEDYLTVYVEKGDDKAMFTPSSHNMWRDGVPTDSRYKAREAIQRTFMFVDRGLYRPGETVTFRGIDRDQILGALKAHSGTYGIMVKGSWWRAPEIVSRISGEASESGGFWGSFKLPDELDSGTYSIIFCRDENYSKDSYQLPSITFTVAEFERLKIEASASVPEVTYFGGDTLSANISADYLAGGALSNADYHVTWYRQPAHFSSKNKETQDYNYGYEYAGREYFSEENGTLSAEGTATVSCQSEKIKNSTPYIYRVEANITDVSNQTISTQASVFVNPASYYIGVKRFQNVNGFAKKGTKLEFPYVLVNSEGNLLSDITNGLSRVHDLTYKITRDDWTLVHEQSVDDTIYARYEKKTVEEDSGKLEVKAKNIITITPKESGCYMLILEGKDENNNPVKTEYSFYVTGGNNYWYDSYDSESITLTPNQSQYNPGETAEILMESPLPAGDYLITVEREGIFTEEIKHFDTSVSVIEVPVASNYVPVVYVSVSSYSMRNGEPTHKYGQPDLDKPKGYYGVTPVFVNPYVRSFSVDIQTDKPTYQPGETATITLSATKNGKAFEGAELTVMAVDRGVLDLIDYHVPNPISFFYSSAYFPLRVKGGDSRALLMDPVTYSIKDLQGGDEDDDKEEERKDFRPTAIFVPVTVTDKDGKATVTFTMPDSLTTYRITAFGVKNDVFALQEDEVTVQNPVNIQQVQPRKLRERDTAECGVLITNLDSQDHEITVNLEVRTPEGNTVQDEQEGRTTIPGAAFVDGETTHKVYVSSGASTVVYFDVAAKTKGTVELVYSISSDILNEKLISPITIEKTYTYETVTMSGSIDNAEKNASVTEQIAIPGFAEDGRVQLGFTLDATRLGPLGSSVNYLFEYPYGCLEQQSSRILPLVIFGDYLDVFNMDSKVTNVKKCVKSFTKNWGKYQLNDGSMPYWPNGIHGSPYVSLRIANIYAVGLERGYTEEDFGINISALKGYIRNMINEPYTSEYLKAYACYIFSMLNDQSIYSTLGELKANMEKYNLSTCALIGLAYANYGSGTAAQKVAEYVRNYLKPDLRTVSVIGKMRHNRWEWYNSDSEELALIMQLLETIDPDDQMVDKCLNTLLESQRSGYWASTASTCRVLDSIYYYIKGRNLDATNFTGSVIVKDKTIMTESFKGAGAKPKTLKLPFDDETIASLTKDTAENFNFKKEGNGNMYYTVEMKYAIPDEMQAARDEGLKITYEIKEADTYRTVNPEDAETSRIDLTSGKLYKATIKIQTNKYREYVALRAPIPSGAEILDSTFVTTSQSAVEDDIESWLSNKNIKDNEIQFFWDELRPGVSVVSFTFRASRRGVYPVPPVTAECMYEPETFGHGEGYLAVIQ